MSNKNIHIDFIFGETWKAIPNHSNYLISSLGRVYSLQRQKMLQPYTDGKKNKPYLVVKLDGTSIRIHKLVAVAFVPNPDGKGVIHHVDNNPLNNNSNNLQWLTSAEHLAIHWEQRRRQQSEVNDNE